MDDANLYSSAKLMQLQDAEDNLNEDIGKINFTECGENILDIGSGDGEITNSKLMKKIPCTTFKMLGVDLSAKMVQFANSKYGNDKVSFAEMDISTKSLDSKYLKHFDHIFSFNCLHWVQDQHQAFKNIYDMMKDNGDMYVVFLAKNDIYDAYESLAKNPKWSPYMTDLPKYISPYHHLKDPKATLNQTMTSIGFKKIDIKLKPREFYFHSIESLRHAVESVNPFNIPANLKNDYFEDYMGEVRKRNLIEEDNNNNEGKTRIKSPYISLVAYATKT